MIRIINFCLIIFFFYPNYYRGQIFLNTDLEDGINFVSEYITSDEFNLIRNSTSDLVAIDSLFLHTKKFYNDDIEESLLALTFGTLPYFEMPLILPLFNIPLKIPLPTTRKSFSKKLANLPSHFLYDSPKNEFGDKDKLAHFFGNAYLEYAIPLFKVSDFMSIFVEKFEETFKVEGAIDKRDLEVNQLGKKFGKSLRKNGFVLPSEILLTKHRKENEQ